MCHRQSTNIPDDVFTLRLRNGVGPSRELVCEVTKRVGPATTVQTRDNQRMMFMEDGKMVNNFQKVGSVSNSHVGNAFEAAAQEYFRRQGMALQRDYQVPVGLSSKKPHKFDLGSGDPPMLVVCKSHTWTGGNNVPSAKLTVWSEAMFYFLLAPEGFRKVLFVQRDFSERRKETLAEYYVRTYAHLIPDNVEVLEYDGIGAANRLR